MPLTMVDFNRDYEVKKINGRNEILKHLEDLGIVVGTIVRVISKGEAGVILDVRGSRIALGMDLANRVLV